MRNLESATPKLKDIAQRLNLSVGTVQRALHNKGGYSRETQELVLREAARCGYVVNAAASALRRAPINLIVVFPEPKGDDRYFFQYVWQGVEKACSDLALYNLRIIRRYAGPGADSTLKVLREILCEPEGSVQGIITNAFNEIDFQQEIEKFSERKIPVFLVNAVKETSKGLYYASANQCVGRLAADMFASFQDNRPGKVLVLGGSHSNVRQAARVSDFYRVMQERCPNLTLIEAHLYHSREQIEALVCDYLRVFEDLCGVYAVSARETLAMCEAVAACPCKERKLFTVGTDVFPELLPYFESGVLTASIYQYPVQQAYTAVKTLVNHITNIDIGSAPLKFPIAAVFRSNASSFCGEALLI